MTEPTRNDDQRANETDAGPVDNRSPSAKAMDWVSKITTASMMLVLPALGGYFVDQWLGTVALFLFLGMILGMVASGWQLYKLVATQPK